MILTFDHKDTLGFVVIPREFSKFGASTEASFSFSEKPEDLNKMQKLGKEKRSGTQQKVIVLNGVTY